MEKPSPASPLNEAVFMVQLVRPGAEGIEGEVMAATAAIPRRADPMRLHVEPRPTRDERSTTDLFSTNGYELLPATPQTPVSRTHHAARTGRLVRDLRRYLRR